MRTRLLEGRRRLRVAALLGNGLVQALAALLAAYCVKMLFDEVLSGAAANLLGPAVLTFGAGFIAAHLLLAGLKILERVESERLGFDYTADVRVELFDHIGGLSPRALSDRNEGAMLVRFVGDLSALKQWVSHGLIRVSVAAVLTVTLLVALAFVSWPLALALTLVLATGAGLGWVLSRPLRTAVRSARRSRALLSGLVAERVQAMSTLRSLGGFDRERRRVLKRSEEAREATIKRASVAGSMVGLVQATLAAATLTTLLVGAHQVASGQLTPGSVVAAITLVSILVSGLSNIGRVVEYWHAAQASLEKINELLSLQEAATPRTEERPQGEAAESARRPNRRSQPHFAPFAFENVSLPGVLNKLNLKAEPGRIVAIAGPSGAGKSTLLQLGARLIDPAEGRILLGDVDIADLPRDDFRRAIALVSAEAPLLRGSIRMNLTYRCPDATQDEIDQVVALCGLEQLLNGSELGDKARIAERGRNLSFGERHRLMLARALLGRPAVLLLDEADSALDDKTAERLADSLKAYPGVILMVSRRQSWLDLAGETWRVRRNGAVISKIAAPPAPAGPEAKPPKSRRSTRTAKPGAERVKPKVVAVKSDAASQKPARRRRRSSAKSTVKVERVA
ncbi:MAG: ABC transporter ATP-binding protein [Phenylobacterium sp.]